LPFNWLRVWIIWRMKKIGIMTLICVSLFLFFLFYSNPQLQKFVLFPVQVSFFVCICLYDIPLHRHWSVYELQHASGRLFGYIKVVNYGGGWELAISHEETWFLCLVRDDLCTGFCSSLRWDNVACRPSMFLCMSQNWLLLITQLV
jgi:hypothetical protein